MTPSSSSKGPPRVFLSYASDDAQSAERLRPLLKLGGFGPWVDSEVLSKEEPWEAAMTRAITSSDFVVALLSRGTRSGRQEQELRAAVGDSQGRLGPRKPLVLPCAVTGTRNAAFDDIVSDFLRQSHVIDFADFDIGWQQLYKSLYKAARLTSFWVPKLLRAVSRHDLDHAAVARMIVKQGFFSKTMNAGGGVEEADLRLLPGELVVEDRTSGRMWTRGCINPDALPQAPLPTKEEEIARWTPSAQQSDEQRALVAARQDMKRQMKLAIEEWTTRLNRERLGGYDDWRLPTLEEAMSLMRRSVRSGGVHISDLFSDHAYIRTVDGSPGPRPVGLPGAGFQTIWIVGYADADCLKIAEEARVPLRFMRTDLD
jgi:TIR domain-containing protein